MSMDALLTQLQAMSGGSLVMSTEQVAKTLAMNPKVISRMRKEGRFPIVHKSIGAKIVYPIATVAEYLLNDKPEPQKQVQPPVSIEPAKRRAISAKAPIQDLSRKMLRRAFVSTLEDEQSRIEVLLQFFKTNAFVEELESSLPNKSEARSRIDEIKI